MQAEHVKHVVGLLRLEQAGQAVSYMRELTEADPDDPIARAYHGVALRRHGDVEDGLRILNEILTVDGEASVRAAHTVALHELSAHYSLCEDWANAAAHLERLAALERPTGELAARLVMAHARAGNDDQARAWGQRTLALKDREGHCDPDQVIAGHRPKSFDPAAKSRNIVSMSLFGDSGYYHECAITVARTLPSTFPEFTCRFYCGADVPPRVLETLRAIHAQVVEMPTGNDGRHPKYWGLFWRFIAFDDPNVDVVLVRDVDCPPIPRERSGIDTWLKSDAPFYAMRDHVAHAEPLLAGLWGGFTGLLPNMTRMISDFVEPSAERHADQRFLRLCIWPRIRDATLCVDSNYRIGRTVDFPDYYPKFGRVHVGAAWPPSQIVPGR